jgi:hypothetical protein
MPPVGIAILLLCLLGFGTTYFIQEHHFDIELNMRLDGAYPLFNKLLEVETDVLESLATTYVDNSVLTKAFLSGDRPTLVREAQPVFEKIRQRFNITHFYFILPDKSCFLRVHNPARHGDRINRYTLDFAAANDTRAYGLELGPLGTLTLRLVIPWRVNGQLIGFIELGKEIEQIAVELKKILDLDINFVVEKKFLNFTGWQSSRRMLGQKADHWDLLPNHVVLASTMAEQPKELRKIFDNPAQFHYGEVFDLSCEHCSYRGVVIPLAEAGIKDIGAIIVLKDFQDITSGNQLIIVLAILTLLIIAILMLLLYKYLGKIESDLTDTHNNLQNEILQHEASERALAAQQGHLDELVAKRTAELAKARAEVKVLSGFLPICAACKDIRTATGEWEQIESYIRDHSEAQFSHGYCPKCAQKLYDDFRNK